MTGKYRPNCSYKIVFRYTEIGDVLLRKETHYRNDIVVLAISVARQSDIYISYSFISSVTFYPALWYELLTESNQHVPTPRVFVTFRMCWHWEIAEALSHVYLERQRWRFWIRPELIQFLMLVLMLLLTLGVNDAIEEINLFLPSVNARVSADARWEYTLIVSWTPMWFLMAN